MLQDKRFLVLWTLILMTLMLLSLSPITIASKSEEGKIRVIIGLRNYDVKAFQERCNSCVIHLEIPELDVVVVEVPKSIVNYLSKLPFVKYVEEDNVVGIFEVQWNVEIINTTLVWSTYNSTYGDAAYGYNATIRVAVLDTGIDYQHTDLSGAVDYCIVSLRNTKTFYKGTNLKNCNDQNGHGTHVAGIIAARLNGQGVAGVAPKAILYAVKVLSAGGSGYISDVAKGIVEAVKGPDNTAGTDDDADVISMSLGGSHSTTLYSAVLYAYNNNVTLVAAAGNEGASQPSCPACYPEVIAVGAVDSNYSVPSWSNRNPDIVAPGVNILSTWPKNKYAYASGTSMACPHVSATIALIQALRLASGLRKLTPSEIRELIVSTTIDLGPSGYDEIHGYGLVDAYTAVTTALTIYE